MKNEQEITLNLKDGIKIIIPANTIELDNSVNDFGNIQLAKIWHNANIAEFDKNYYANGRVRKIANLPYANDIERKKRLIELNSTYKKTFVKKGASDIRRTADTGKELIVFEPFSVFVSLSIGTYTFDDLTRQNLKKGGYKSNNNTDLEINENDFLSSEDLGI